ncbi:Methyltransferase domain [Carpediemonas membranifera]|uniref:Methyltransferase domain n=1 Tax=Carpediemonas membranifera TaxID=201153 RepID=A0A8J6E9D7_9EUKA|nr:Methyltransferase domain [Carpediemonas membranifera]|eukprot:KAG9393190.1 Methyltransferase domain [Carpediemonas membranifera]
MSISTEESFQGKGVFPAKYAFTLLIPLRNIFLSPKLLIERLDLKPGHRVLEIGPGPGYFSTHIAKKLDGPSGHLTLADLQPAMLNKARKRLEARKLTNVDYVQLDGTGLDFPESSFDRVFMVTVIGEVQPDSMQRKYIEDISRIMKMDGILSISELAGDPDKLSTAELTELVCSGGSFEVKKIFGSERNYTANFSKL